PWPVFAGAVVERAEGGRTLRGVAIRDSSGARLDIACDLLAVCNGSHARLAMPSTLAAICNGWTPLLHLTPHLGGRPVWDESLQAFTPGTLPQGTSVAGAAAGHLSLSESLSDGARLGAEAAQHLGFDAVTVELPAADEKKRTQSDS